MLPNYYLPEKQPAWLYIFVFILKIMKQLEIINFSLFNFFLHLSAGKAAIFIKNDEICGNLDSFNQERTSKKDFSHAVIETQCSFFQNFIPMSFPHLKRTNIFKNYTVKCIEYIFLKKFKLTTKKILRSTLPRPRLKKL